MRRALLGPALVGALLATPALGADEGLKLSGEGEFITNYVNLGGGSAVIQSDEANELWTVGGGSALDAALGGWHLQTDFAGEGTVHNENRDDTYKGSFGGGWHVGWRDPEIGQIAAFAMVGKFTINDVGKPNRKSVSWGAGGEGQYYFDPVTLYLQGGFIDREPVANGGDKAALKNAGFFRLVTRYFPLEDLKLEIGGAYCQGKMDPDSDNVWIGDWNAEAEYRWPGTPVSGFVKYTGAYMYQDDDNDKFWENRVGFGIRVYFGQGTLKQNDRNGTSLSLPRYLQWQGDIAGPLE